MSINDQMNKIPRRPFKDSQYDVLQLNLQPYTGLRCKNFNFLRKNKVFYCRQLLFLGGWMRAEAGEALRNAAICWRRFFNTSSFLSQRTATITHLRARIVPVAMSKRWVLWRYYCKKKCLHYYRTTALSSFLPASLPVTLLHIHTQVCCMCLLSKKWETNDVVVCYCTSSGEHIARFHQVSWRLPWRGIGTGASSRCHLSVFSCRRSR